MPRLLKRSLLAALLALPGFGWAQNELSNFTATGRGGVSTTFATDYQAIGINPGNLGRVGGARFAFTIGEFGAGLGSQSLTRTQLRKFIYQANDKLTLADKQVLARQFTSNNALNLNVDATSLAVSLAVPGVGSVAISNRQRISSHVGLNKNAAEIAFLGKDAPIFQNYNIQTAPLLSEALAGTELQMAWLNEFNLALGTRLIDLPLVQLSAGAGYRYIQGVGIVDLRVSGGKVEAYGSMSPLFKIDYGSLATNPSFNLRQRARGLQPVGEGHGFDLGLALEAGKKLRLGAAVTDLGHMTWEGNLVTASDQKLKRLRSTGISSYDFFQEAAQIFSAGSDSLFQYQPSQTRRAALPAKFRAGAGLRISEYFETGLDVTLPLNKVAGNIPAPFVGLGVDYKPIRWLRLSSGLSTGAGYSLSVPLGLTLTSSIYEAGISTRDVAGLLTKENPYLSVAAGFLRFKFGKEQ
ncbi:hypothetical protein SAMN02745146_1149 [Hymenobacter daecheongensis DSM 21074]|uniref:DUF5723 domain-containing protein n=1 Tax=Hymenobacter daecheongensis DSM 21074 TaxID=1121955 RepID=A0A1M6CGQ3_9BACT|nr:DUF5723 family protein [Hymenobacter daecheongensis]SHI60166.1 hypothetical protein SAMN02745146_1149 [Hymenobacter daecheongensis DSM 21074]